MVYFTEYYYPKLEDLNLLSEDMLLKTGRFYRIHSEASTYVLQK